MYLQIFISCYNIYFFLTPLFFKKGHHPKCIINLLHKMHHSKTQHHWQGLLFRTARAASIRLLKINSPALILLYVCLEGNGLLLQQTRMCSMSSLSSERLDTGRSEIISSSARFAFQFSVVFDSKHDIKRINKREAIQ